ncbi:hypothetical protein EDD37DRAFT_286982 [Exophiala viscosa]|uniref:uncharacterized protein n=1 Tax=Exophiala viscosa TaxID=2486360 RepID=UPI00219BA3B2|nr:hypothetical protein EDD37DRAFT_286982 [Exophiala viscosa]
MHDRAVVLLQLKPCLAELLRTCVQPQNPIVRVEHVFGQALPRSHRNAAAHEQDGNADHASDGKQSDKAVTSCLRLVLSDGHLQIHAVLARHLHTRELLELQRGDLVRTKKFHLRKAARLNGQGRVIYLGVENCEWVGRELSEEPQFESEGEFLREEADTTDMPPKPLSSSNDTILDLDLMKKRSIDAMGSGRKHGKIGRTELQLPGACISTPQKRPRNNGCESDDDEDSFETITVTPLKMEKRRNVLRQISQDTHNIQHDSSDLEANNPPQINDDAQSMMPCRTAQPTDDFIALYGAQNHEVKIKPPPAFAITAPVHTLSSLLDPKSTLPRRSYTCTILAVVSWVSPSTIHKANTPFPPKRHVKVHDPTISSRQAGVTLAVYVDAKNFLPEVGTIALLQGVVMQRFGDDIILNKYATPIDDKADHNRCDWFVTDEELLIRMGFDMLTMRGWWQERASKKT